MSSTRIELVTNYVERGWTPFLYANMSTPSDDWPNAVVDGDTVNRIAASDHPVGIVTGKKSGLVVIDVDVQNGGSVEALVTRYGKDVKNTRVVTTPSGGWHLYFKYPENVDRLTAVINGSGQKIRIAGLAGIDLLADGRHVKAPPTARVGIPGKADGSYNVRLDLPVADLPSGLLADWLEVTEKRTWKGSGVVTGVISPRDYQWALDKHGSNVRATEDELPGNRDNFAFSKICSSVRIAKALPEDVLSISTIEADYSGVTYGIKDLDGKLLRAIEFAEVHPWEEATQDELTTDLPEGIREEDAWEYFRQLSTLRVRDAVKETMQQERIEREASRLIITDAYDGSDFMDMVIGDPEWLVDGLFSHGGRTLVTAQYKAGKSTMMLELTRALTTGTPFLGEFPVPAKSKVALFDLELGVAMAQRWLRDVEGIDYSKLLYRPLVGKGAELDMRSAGLRNKTARQLREASVDILIVDPISPVLSALGLDENRADHVRPLLDMFDVLAAEADLKGVVITHHAGHESPDRARGSTAFMDWNTSQWSITRHGEDATSRRSFKAIGRDAAVSRRDLEFDRATRKLTLASTGLTFTDDPFLTESRGRTLTAQQAATGLSASLNTAKAKLRQNGWIETTHGRAGVAGLWEWTSSNCADPFD